MNPSPHRARMGKRRRARPGDISAVQTVLWRCIATTEALLDGEPSPEMHLRIVHALSQVCSTYIKVIEVGELEERISTLERQSNGPPA